MKLKNWLLWLCVVALLATEVFLLSANQQKDAARIQLREAKTELEQLHVAIWINLKIRASPR